MLPGPTEVAEDSWIGAAGLLQRVGQDGQAGNVQVAGGQGR